MKGAQFVDLYGYHGVSWVYRSEHQGPEIPECVVGALYVCPTAQDLEPFAAATGTPSPKPTRAEAEAMVTRVLVQLHLPRPAIRIGPDPSANEWNMAVVGLPVWLWTDEPATRSASVTAFENEFVLSARRDSVAFTMGDGSPRFTCVSMTPYPGDPGIGKASPDCGHTFVQPSLPAGEYLVTATAQWTITWSALGYTGTLQMPMTSTRRVPVGELQSVRQR